MAIRNCRELGENLQKVMSRLLANDNLVKLLYYTDPDPLNNNNLSSEEKSSLIFGKLIRIIPRVEAKETANSIIVIRVIDGIKNVENDEFRDISIGVEVFCPLTQFLIKGTNLRIFSIIGEIQTSLCGKTINGLGKMEGGDFSLKFITDDLACYEVSFDLTSYA